MKRLPILLCFLFSLCRLAAQDGSVHAVIVSGGMNKLMNQERYWNDCSFLYKALLNDYHIPRQNITLLISDGGAPGDDQLRSDGGGLTSSSADLDGDGMRDVYLAATMQNMVSVLSALSNKLTADDHFFLFLIDHGGSDDKQTSSYLWLWNSEKLYDKVLASLIGLFNVATVNIVAGQCYSGGFIDDLAATGRIVSTACRGNELSWNCTDRLYDEFVYHWTCAIAGHDEAGAPVNADTNDDGRVTMFEAFAYARSHDRRDETPQFSATPYELGQRWTFDGILLPEDDGIDPVTYDAAALPSTGIFDLAGRPVRGQMQSGVYIKNGRKIMK